MTETKTAVKRTAKKTTTKTAAVQSTKAYFQCNGKEFDINALMKKAEEKAKKITGKDAETLDMYINYEEDMVYFVVNGEEHEEYRFPIG